MSLRVDVQASAGTFALDVSFEMGGRTAALLGPSGAGKTLTLRAIAGLLTPHAGLIELDGDPLFDSRRSIDVPVRRRHVGYVFQDYALFPHLTAAENIAFGLRVPRDEGRGVVARMISLLRLGGLEGRYPGTLSGGERQRVALGRALAAQPQLLLLDEPFSALDMATRSALTEEFLELRASIDVPTLLVTHDVGEAYALCDDLILLDGGTVLQSGPISAVYDRPASPRAAQLVGMQNLLTGRVVETSAARGVVEAAGMRIAVDSPMHLGSAVEVGFRADAVEATLVSEGDATLVRSVNRGTQGSGVFAMAGGATVTAALRRPVGETLPATGWRLAVRDGAGMAWPSGGVHR